MHDRFKTCCYVQYTSETDMRAAGKRLSGVVWPEETGQQLQTEIRSQNHLLVDDATTAAAPADGGARVRRGDVGSTDASNLARVQRNSINNDLSTAAVPPPPPRGRGGIFDRISAPTPSDTRGELWLDRHPCATEIHERLSPCTVFESMLNFLREVQSKIGRLDFERSKIFHGIYRKYSATPHPLTISMLWVWDYHL